MIIMGIDPGTATTGYGILRVLGNRFQTVDYGVITTLADEEMPSRLVRIYNALGELIDAYQPEQVAIEKLFFGRNTTTAITVGQARGVMLLQAEQQGLAIAEYTPLQVKQALVGYGQAEKKQVQHMVKVFLGLKDIPKPDDAADALAIAICHAHHRQTLTRRTCYDRLS